MKTRVSQFELQPSVEPDSNRAESFASQPELAAVSMNKFSSACSHPLLTNSETLSSRIPFYLIGLLLALTAIAKLWMMLTDSFADMRVGLPKEILWLSVAFELWLAFENFRVLDHRVIAFINTIVFASFAIFASIRLAMGYGSCGCSGSLEIPAWIFILIDIGIVAWFACSTFRRNLIASGLRQLSHGWSSWSHEKCGRLAGLGLFASLIFALQLNIAAPLRAMFLGEPPLIATFKVDGDLVLDQESRGTVEIWNRSSQPAKIIGISLSCSCVDLARVHISKTIPANQKLVLPLAIMPNKVGQLRQRIELFLNHPKQFRVNVDVFGSVKGE